MSSYISGYNHPSLLAAVNKPENIVSRDEMSFMHLQQRITLFILMDYSIDIVNMELSFFTSDKFLSLTIVFIFANSADPDEMALPPYVPFHSTPTVCQSNSLLVSKMKMSNYQPNYS